MAQTDPVKIVEAYSEAVRRGSLSPKEASSQIRLILDTYQDFTPAQRAYLAAYTDPRTWGVFPDVRAVSPAQAPSLPAWSEQAGRQDVEMGPDFPDRGPAESPFANLVLPQAGYQPLPGLWEMGPAFPERAPAESPFANLVLPQAAMDLLGAIQLGGTSSPAGSLETGTGYAPGSPPAGPAVPANNGSLVDLALTGTQRAGMVPDQAQAAVAPVSPAMVTSSTTPGTTPGDIWAYVTSTDDPAMQQVIPAAHLYPQLRVSGGWTKDPQTGNEYYVRPDYNAILKLYAESRGIAPHLVAGFADELAAFPVLARALTGRPLTWMEEQGMAWQYLDRLASGQTISARQAWPRMWNPGELSPETLADPEAQKEMVWRMFSALTPFMSADTVNWMSARLASAVEDWETQYYQSRGAGPNLFEYLNQAGITSWFGG